MKQQGICGAAARDSKLKQALGPRTKCTDGPLTGIMYKVFLFIYSLYVIYILTQDLVS